MSFKKFTFALAASTALLTTPAWAEVTLEDALVAAYQKNPTLQAQRETLRATDETYSQARAGWRPQLSAQGSLGYSQQDNNPSFANAKDEREPRSVGLIFQQPLYRGGRTVAGQQQALNTIRQGRGQLLDTEQQVFLQVVEAFVGVQQAEAVVKLNENNEEVLRRNLEATRDRFKVGEVTLTDVSQAESRLSGASAATIQAQGELTSARAAFEQVTGISPDALAEVDAAPDLPANQSEAVSLALSSNPRVIAAQYAYDAAQNTVRAQKGFLLPEATLNGQVNNEQETSVLGGSSNTAQVTAQLTIPLYQSGAEWSRVRQAQAQAEQARQQMLQERRTAQENAIRAWTALETARAQIESLNAQVRAGEVALEGVRQEMMVGSRTVLDVLNAEQELLNARVDLVRANANRTTAQYSLLSALGRLNTANLKLETPIYRPEAHFEKVANKWIGFGETPRATGQAENPEAQPVSQLAGNINNKSNGVSQ